MEHKQTDDLVASEEAKRNRRINPQERWRQFQALCAWLDSQQAVPRNSKAGCLAAQARRDQADRANAKE